MGLECNTKITSDVSPRTILSSLVKKEFISGISQRVGVTNLDVFTVRITGGSDAKEFFDLAIEPLATDQDKMYHFSLSYRTLDNTKFNQFVSIFGEDLINKIMEEASKYAKSTK